MATSILHTCAFCLLVYFFVQVTELDSAGTRSLTMSSLTAINTNSLQLNWTLSTTEGLVYCCQVTCLPRDSSQTVSVDNNTDSAVIGGLTPGCNYAVQVCADYTNSTECSTNKTNNTYPSKPTDLTLKSRSTTGFKLTYQQLGCSDGVQYYANSSAADLIQTEWAPYRNPPEVDVSGLLAGFLYDTNLSAYSGLIFNKSDTAAFMTSPPAPGEVVCKPQSNGSLYVTVLPPPPSSWTHYQLDQYVIHYSFSGDCNVSGKVEFIAGGYNQSVDIVLVDVNSGQQYHICVYSISGGVYSDTRAETRCNTTVNQLTTSELSTYGGSTESTLSTSALTSQLTTSMSVLTTADASTNTQTFTSLFPSTTDTAATAAASSTSTSLSTSAFYTPPPTTNENLPISESSTNLIANTSEWLNTTTEVPPSGDNLWIIGAVVGAVVVLSIVAASVAGLTYVLHVGVTSMSYSVTDASPKETGAQKYSQRYSYVFPELSDVIAQDSNINPVSMVANGNSLMTSGI